MPLRRLHGAGSTLLTAAQYAGLAVIALATMVAGVQEVMVMIGQGKVALADLLLLFIYLEVLTMTGVYYQSGQLPVRFPLYIAIVALARYLILDTKQLDAVRIANRWRRHRHAVDCRAGAALWPDLLSGPRRGLTAPGRQAVTRIARP